MNKPKKRMLIVGYGLIGKSHVEIMKAMGNVEIVGIVRKDIKKKESVMYHWLEKYRS